MLDAIIVFTLLGLAFGALLGFAAVHFKVEGDPMVDRIDAILPQTQCGQCGFPGCRPYATAIAREEADINCCPPGGEAGVLALADLLGKEVKPLQAEDTMSDTKTFVFIDEHRCIGCTKCIQACPVDAIVGAAKHMHTVIKDLCTGCNLCIPPCPVDCIEVREHPITLDNWKWPAPQVIEYREAG